MLEKKTSAIDPYIIRLLILAFILLLGGIIYFFFNPEESDLFPQCPFHYLTGLDCPGCGSQRAIHHLLHLNIGEAIRYNFLLVVSIPYLILGIYIEYFGGESRYPKAKVLLFGRMATYIVLIAIISFWVLRNIIK